MPGSRDENLTIFITSISGSESLASFTSRFFHFRRPSDLRLAFDAAERNEKFGRIQCHGDIEKERSIPLQKNSERRSKKQRHHNELSENCRKGVVRWGERAARGE